MAELRAKFRANFRNDTGIFEDNTAYFSTELENLINTSFKKSWSVDTQINWDQEVVIPSGMDQQEYLDLVSQLYHSEVLTIHICSRLIHEVPDFQAKQFLCTQLADEARHAQAYSKYIDKIGKRTPIDPAMKKLYAKALKWNGSYIALIVAINVVLETESLQQQRKRIETLPCPIFREINQNVIRDESRHAAFGSIYLKDKLSDLPLVERQKILKWIGGLWKGWENANRGRYQTEAAAFLRTSQNELTQRHKNQMNRFKKIGLIKAEVKYASTF